MAKPQQAVCLLFDWRVNKQKISFFIGKNDNRLQRLTQALSDSVLGRFG
jgi:hypothetical protein